MRELNRHEVEEVSGAGIISDAATALGMGIGKVVDTVKETTTATEAGATLGYGIGQVVEASLSVVSNFLGGILGGLFGRR